MHGPVALRPPDVDPTPVLDIVDSQFGFYVLAAATRHLKVFDSLAGGAKPAEALRLELGLAPRAAIVLFGALRALGLLAADAQGALGLTDLSREHLRSDSPFDTGCCFDLATQGPEVVGFVRRLRDNAPGDYFIHRSGSSCTLHDKKKCRAMTLALAGRARSVAPCLARAAPLSGVRRLLDVGCGSGLYSIACLQAYPELRAIAVDHENVLEIAKEIAVKHGVADRLECCPGDMFADPLPGPADAVLLSNVLHDWDVPDCRALISRCVQSLASGGRLIVHDYFLNDSLDGPLPVALRSIGLFCRTRGRVYSGAECAAWLRDAGMRPQGPIIPTLAHQGMLVGMASS